jgi:hypothetical protein
MAIWDVFGLLGIFYEHLVHFLFIWHIFSSFGSMSKEESGNPGAQGSFPLRMTI